ncbi:MAG: FkbM family methyltransferase [Spirochaetes bacterium]|jgi:FkbM family methyltransferase|nr:FkbM family methyltransferase [Spirochaetota bacterium]
MFLDKIVSGTDKREADIKILKNSKYPVVFYGAAEFASELGKFLCNYGISAAAYFVDDEYINSDLNFFKDVKTFDEITKLFDKFNIVIANISDVKRARDKISSKKCDQVMGVYLFDYLRDNSFDGFDMNYIKKHEKEFGRVYELLNDDLSKKTYTDFINSKLNNNYEYLHDFFYEQYFLKDLITVSDDEVFVDGGAFTGDTLLSYIKNFGNRYQKYYAFEPGTGLPGLRKLIEKENIKNVTIIEKGLWSKQDVLHFSTGTQDGRINESGDLEISVDSIDNLCADATFIKMDIEGAELEALKGAAGTINKNMPKLAICIYHKPEDLFEIPLYIKSIAPDYKIFVRHHKYEIGVELVLYAIMK